MFDGVCLITYTYWAYYFESECKKTYTLIHIADTHKNKLLSEWF